MKKGEIIKLFKSGNFSIIYTDYKTPIIYKGKKTIEEIEDGCDIDKIEIDYYSDGYVPEIVELLVKALGGNSDSV